MTGEKNGMNLTVQIIVAVVKKSGSAVCTGLCLALTTSATSRGESATQITFLIL